MHISQSQSTEWELTLKNHNFFFYHKVKGCNLKCVNKCMLTTDKLSSLPRKAPPNPSTVKQLINKLIMINYVKMIFLWLLLVLLDLSEDWLEGARREIWRSTPGSTSKWGRSRMVWYSRRVCPSGAFQSPRVSCFNDLFRLLQFFGPIPTKIHSF